MKMEDDHNFFQTKKLKTISKKNERCPKKKEDNLKKLMTTYKEKKKKNGRQPQK
jgi:hypothetical protein